MKGYFFFIITDWLVTSSSVVEPHGSTHSLLVDIIITLRVILGYFAGLYGINIEKYTLLHVVYLKR